MTRFFIFAALLMVVGTISGPVVAQSGPPVGILRGRDAALTDLTGNWVSIVDEDWRWRMVTPAKGDYASIPLNEGGKKAADRWDLAKDEADGNQCRAYGAAGLMRVPTRLHVTWAA